MHAQSPAAEEGGGRAGQHHLKHRRCLNYVVVLEKLWPLRPPTPLHRQHFSLLPF
jgi:hypothetical protein